MPLPADINLFHRIFRHQKEQWRYLSRYLFFGLCIGALAGSASAFFLFSLNQVTLMRETQNWIYWLLPMGGLCIGLIYHYWGSDVVKGNNQLLEEFQEPRKIIPLKMAPMVLWGTLTTHLFGGSAGREGTAVQMGGAIADQFSHWFRLNTSERRNILVCGISAGFASVFGTPLAGAIFAIEVMTIGRMRYESILPSFIASVAGWSVCNAWGIHHTHYTIGSIPEASTAVLTQVALAGILFGLTAILFSRSAAWFSALFQKIHYPPLRPFVGGIVLAALFLLFPLHKYAGLGIPGILDSFSTLQQPEVFLIKLLLTTFTLSAGFKGGEVTPLFFVGAALGSALAAWFTLPVGLLAGLGFVAVFAGATNTPIACMVMGIELFGAQAAIYMAIACVMAYFFSGHTGIYSSQMISTHKNNFGRFQKGKRLNEL